jgi:ABC-type branched-subunit amino acid transport system permease subunit
VFLIGMAVIARFVKPPVGMILSSIRENEQRAVSPGLLVARHRLDAR